jgi:DNA end-binding protein Ku
VIRSFLFGDAACHLPAIGGTPFAKSRIGEWTPGNPNKEGNHNFPCEGIMPYSWNGHLKFSLVTIPVRFYSAVDTNADEIHFNQLHRDCRSRIRYQKTCPIHGEITQDQIVLGYEYEKGKYIVVEKDELEALQSDAEKSVSVEVVVPLTAIDPIYFTDRTSFLVPDGAISQQSYAVILQALADQNLAAVGRLVKNGKDSIVMIRPNEHVMAMTVLSSASQVLSPLSVAAEAPRIAVSAQELKLTKSLLDVFYKKKLELSDFPEHYSQRVKELVEAKIAGKQIAMPPTDEHPPVINLMDALKKSLATVKSSSQGPKRSDLKLSRSSRPPVSRPRKKSG